MTIAIFGDYEFIPEIGGTERVSVSLAKMLKQYGYGVYFVAWHKYKQLRSYPFVAEQIILPNGGVLCCEENILFLTDFIVKKKVDIIINQYGPFEDFSNFCFIAKEKTKVKLLSVIHFAPDFAIKAYRADLSRLNYRSYLVRHIRFYMKRVFPYRLNRIKRKYACLYNRLYRESDAVIRVISARKASKRERKKYGDSL